MLDPERSLASTDGRRRGEGKRNRASITSHPPDERDWIDDPLLHTKHMSASACVRPSHRPSQLRKPENKRANPASSSQQPHARTNACHTRCVPIGRRIGKSDPIQPAQGDRPGQRQRPPRTAPNARHPAAGTTSEASVALRACACTSPRPAPPRPGRKAAGRTTRILLDRRGRARSRGSIVEYDVVALGPTARSIAVEKGAC